MPQYGRALYDFPGGEATDLAFQEDDVVLILEKDDSGWWSGEHCTDGRRGEFPFNYVELISEEEAMRVEKAKATGARPPPSASKPAKFEFRGDSVKDVKIGDSEHSGRGRRLNMKIQATMSSGKTRTVKKTVSQFRDLDAQLRKLFPSFEAKLPPTWADHAKVGKLDKAKREDLLERYLKRFIGIDATDYLLALWLFPGEKVEVSTPSDALAAAAAESERAGEPRDSVKQSVRMGEVPEMAAVEFTWQPQDDAELFMQETQLIAVLTQDTGSPGWWEGETIDGKRGLFPYNHVELLDSRVAAAVVAGTSLSKAQAVKYDTAAGGYAETKGQPKRSSARKSMSRISLGLFGAGKKQEKKKAQAKARARKVIQPYYIASCESFDRLIDNGFTMEENGKICSMSPPRDAPKEGDFVQLSYVAYVWDDQKMTAVEFDASDNRSNGEDAGPMEFFVGNGEVIKGIEYAVQRMSPGQSVRLTVTPQLAYGAVGLPPDIPPHTHLIYDVTLDAFGSEDSVDVVDMPPPPKESTSITSMVPPSMAAKPPMPTSAKPNSFKPSQPTSRKPSFGGQAAAPRAPAAPTGGPAKPPAPAGKPTSLAEAIALRRQKLEAGVVAKPIASRPDAKSTRVSRVPGRVQLDGDEEDTGGVLRAAPAVEYEKPNKSYTLEQLQAAVRDKVLDKLRIEAARIEDYLTDEEFDKAFKMSRTDFLLKPRWRQQAIKRGLGLF
ncbi:Peptidyl-prolyl cis-trans isomerase FKBP65 (PPIase FKBP65) (70 kDa peptidyl-prolyl isomerase) (FK506-binding protein 65) (AtFKBP65) (Immunophilin FKBP65) (Peptidyl-prolyl isomerase ROF2) (Protein ROTAMASE FKBP 2) (Rotamase) [Durusdinium trenchii]|uniref:peptidylprolyl isomerase n=1 Tax=Durusdinium trenchii TaxID=1381693 RepID=A0ABP0LUU4_9DINO